MLTIYGEMKFASLAVTPEQKAVLRKEVVQRGGIQAELINASERYLYARAVFMGYDLPNGNGDAIPSFYASSFGPSFIGKHVDIDHKLDPDSKVGTIKATWHVERPLPLQAASAAQAARVIGRHILGRDIDGRPGIFLYSASQDAQAMELQLEGIFEVDRELRSGAIVAKKLLAKDMDSVSQEASTNYCLCPVCAHKIAAMTDLPCEHLMPGNLMLKAFRVNGYDNDILAYKVHHEPSGTGLGCVGVPAFERAKIDKLMAQLKQGTLQVSAMKKLIQEQKNIWGNSLLVLQASHELELIEKDILVQASASPKTVVAMGEGSKRAVDSMSREELLAHAKEGWDEVKGGKVEDLDDASLRDFVHEMIQDGDVKASVKVKAGSPSIGDWMVIHTGIGENFGPYDTEEEAEAAKDRFISKGDSEDEVSVEEVTRENIREFTASKSPVAIVQSLAAAKDDKPEVLASKLVALAAGQGRLNIESAFLARQSAVVQANEFSSTEPKVSGLAERIGAVAEVQWAVDASRKSLLAAMKVELPKGSSDGMLPAWTAQPIIKHLSAALTSKNIPMAAAAKRHLDAFLPGVDSLQAALDSKSVNRAKCIGLYAELTKKFDSLATTRDDEKIAGVQAAVTAFAAAFDVMVQAQPKADLGFSASVSKTFGIPETVLAMPRRLRLRAGTNDLVAALKSGKNDERIEAVVDAFADSTGEWITASEEKGLFWALNQTEPKDSIEAAAVVNGLALLRVSMGKAGVGSTFIEAALQKADAKLKALMAAEVLAAKRRVIARAWMAEFKVTPTPIFFNAYQRVLKAAGLPNEEGDTNVDLATSIGKEIQASGGPWPWTDSKPVSWTAFLGEKTDEELGKLETEWSARLTTASVEAKQNIENNLSKLREVLADRKRATGVTAQFFRKPSLADSHWLLRAANGAVAGRITLAAAAGSEGLDRTIEIFDPKASDNRRKLDLSSHLQSEAYGQNLVAHAKTFGLKALLGQFEVKSEPAQDGQSFQDIDGKVGKVGSKVVSPFNHRKGDHAFKGEAEVIKIEGPMVRLRVPGVEDYKVAPWHGSQLKIVSSIKVAGEGKAHVKVAYQVVTDKSAETGEAAEEGIDEEYDVELDEFDKEEGKTLVDLVAKKLEEGGLMEASSSEFTPGVWYSTGESQRDDGSYITYTFHVSGLSAKEEKELWNKFGIGPEVPVVEDNAALGDLEAAWMASLETSDKVRHDSIMASFDFTGSAEVLHDYLRREMSGESNALDNAWSAAKGKADILAMAKSSALTASVMTLAASLAPMVGGHAPIRAGMAKKFSTAFTTCQAGSELSVVSITEFADGSMGIAMRPLSAFASVREAAQELSGVVDLSFDAGTDLKQVVSKLRSADNEHIGKGVLSMASRARLVVKSATPKGFEPVVKELKKNSDVKNPWAVAWSMKNKGDKVHKAKASLELAARPADNVNMAYYVKSGRLEGRGWKLEVEGQPTPEHLKTIAMAIRHGEKAGDNPRWALKVTAAGAPFKEGDRVYDPKMDDNGTVTYSDHTQITVDWDFIGQKMLGPEPIPLGKVAKRGIRLSDETPGGPEGPGGGEPVAANLKIKAMWVDKVQDSWNSIGDLQGADDNYGVAKRCGFDSAEEMWEANPAVVGGVNPADLQVVDEAKVPEMKAAIEAGISDREFREKFLDKPMAASKKAEAGQGPAIKAAEVKTEMVTAMVHVSIRDWDYREQTDKKVTLFHEAMKAVRAVPKVISVGDRFPYGMDVKVNVGAEDTDSSLQLIVSGIERAMTSVETKGGIKGSKILKGGFVSALSDQEWKALFDEAISDAMKVGQPLGYWQSRKTKGVMTRKPKPNLYLSVIPMVSEVKPDGHEEKEFRSSIYDSAGDSHYSKQVGVFPTAQEAFDALEAAAKGAIEASEKPAISKQDGRPAEGYSGPQAIADPTLRLNEQGVGSITKDTNTGTTVVS